MRIGLRSRLDQDDYSGWWRESRFSYSLKWIKRNIAAFGGDPGRVTIFGQSAGGEQVLALVASPLAAGLFHRAISMSAPAGLSLPTVAKIAPKRAAFAAKLGCSDEATQPACLRRPTAQQIIDAAEEGDCKVATLPSRMLSAILGIRKGNGNRS